MPKLKDVSSLDNDSTIDDLMQQDRFAQVRTKDDENGSQEPMADKSTKKSTTTQKSEDNSEEPADKSRDDYGDTPTDVNERSDERFKQKVVSRVSVSQLKKQHLNHA